MYRYGIFVDLHFDNTKYVKTIDLQTVKNMFFLLTSESSKYCISTINYDKKLNNITTSNISSLKQAKEFLNTVKHSMSLLTFPGLNFYNHYIYARNTKQENEWYFSYEIIAQIMENNSQFLILKNVDLEFELELLKYNTTTGETCFVSA